MSVWVEIFAVIKAFAENICHAPRERVSWNLAMYNAEFTQTLSRSTWACELKCGDIQQRHMERRVTLHVSVWVEILYFFTFKAIIWSRSTWACELKFAPFPKFVPHISHAPRERVSWNLVYSAVKLSIGSRSTWACELKWIGVAHHTSVTGHAPRERVSWNCAFIQFLTISPSHAPRERVSWNINGVW